MTMRVLALDIEGGYGGSSRSLYETLRYLPKGSAELEVWCRRQGPIQQRYAEIGIDTEVWQDMTHVSALPRLSRNIIVFGRQALAWSRASAFREALLTAAGEVDLIHLNHEGLFLLARWLRPRTNAAITAHVRTHLPRSLFASWQYRTLFNAVDRSVFITENERDRAFIHARRPARGGVIFNVAMPNEVAVPDPKLAKDRRFKVAVLSNFAFMRGIDRMIDVAVALKAADRRDIVFVMAGDMKLKGNLPGRLGEIAGAGGTLEDYARAEGVADWFIFCGHVHRPECILQACDVLAKPTREANPWGRDILEGLAAGLPVLSLGCYDRFVEDGVTGVLTPEFEPLDWAERIVALSEDKAVCAKMGAAGRTRVGELCNGPARAQDLLTLWRSAIEDRIAVRSGGVA